MNIFQNVFYNNTCLNGSGGVLYNEFGFNNIVLQNNIFELNTANNENGGGGLYFFGLFNNFQIKNNTFLHNSAINGDGGAILLTNSSANISIISSVFK